MAASLMEIKSRMLLPRGQAAVGESEADDPLDPRWELVHQLLQYKKFKEAAAKLDELAAFQRDMLARHVIEVAVTENERPLKPVDRIEVWNVFNIVLRRLAEKLVVGEIKGEEVTVSDKMEELLQLVQTHKKFLFTELFDGRAVTVRVLVATFIAVLELTRLKKLRIRQDEAYTDIHIEAVEDGAPDFVAASPHAPVAEPAPEPVTVVAIDLSAEAPGPVPDARSDDDASDNVSDDTEAEENDDAPGLAHIPRVITATPPAPAPEPEQIHPENPLETPDEGRTLNP